MAYSEPLLKEYWTPALARVLFWAYAALVGVGAGLAVASGQWLVAFGCVLAIFGVRIAIETVLVLFEMRNLLKDIRDQRPEADPGVRLAAVRAKMEAQTSPATPGEMRLG